MARPSHMTASKRWRCYDAGLTSQFPLCLLASTPQLPPLNLLGLALTRSIPRPPTSVTRSDERRPSMRPSHDAYGCSIPCSASSAFHEPPYAEPHVRWCGRATGVTRSPTRSSIHASSQLPVLLTGE